MVSCTHRRIAREPAVTARLRDVVWHRQARTVFGAAQADLEIRHRARGRTEAVLVRAKAACHRLPVTLNLGDWHGEGAGARKSGKRPTLSADSVQQSGFRERRHTAQAGVPRPLRQQHHER